jgi:hypothetical protein
MFPNSLDRDTSLNFVVINDEAFLRSRDCHIQLFEFYAQTSEFTIDIRTFLSVFVDHLLVITIPIFFNFDITI